MFNQRYHKSLTEKIYLLSANQVSNDFWQFKLRGQSLNVYEQRLKGDSFYCSCPDHKTRGSFCKHLIFLISRVARNEGIGYEMNIYKNNWSEEKFKIVSKELVERLKSRLECIKEKPKIEQCVEGDCPICFEEMTKDTETVKCVVTCKNWFHKECMDIWLNNHDTCPLCRSDWCSNLEEICEFNQNLEVKFMEQVQISVQEVPVEEIQVNYRMYEVGGEIGLKEFCVMNGIDRKKKIFYEMRKKELLTSNLDVVFYRISDEKYFDGQETITKFNLNLAGVMVDPSNYNDGNIFVQCLGMNRKLIIGQKLLVKN